MLYIICYMLYIICYMLYIKGQDTDKLVTHHYLLFTICYLLYCIE